MSTHIETIIIGGGQAGLAVSYYLSRQDRPHIVLEQAAEVGNAWRNHRWDSFTLNTPNWQSWLPGADIPGKDPDGFLTRDEVVAYFESYVDTFHLPLRGVHVDTVTPRESGRGFVAETSAGRFEAENVVIATGLYQALRVPSFSANFPQEVKQIHSDEYRSPESLPAGAVLVVGSGQSGVQIAEELYQSGRKVYLSVSRSGRVPRRYRGKDANWWHNKMGDYERTVDQLPAPQAKFASKPQISGQGGGHTINLHQFARDGVTLLGRIQGVSDGTISLAPDLRENLARADKAEADFVKHVDEYIAKSAIDAPEEVLPNLKDGYNTEEMRELDLRASNITVVIWATGYSFDFSLVRLPILDSDGYPVQKRGITDYPGLYFVGLPWLHNAKSGLLFGTAQDAAYIASAINEEADRHLTSRSAAKPSSAVSRPNLEFTGKVALITGGTSGIGAVTARRVAELGARVVITGRRLREGRLLVNEIKRNGGCAAFFQADLSQPDQVRLIVPFTVETFGRLNYAFNNAATSGREPAADRSDRRELRSCIRCQRKGVVSSASGGGEPDARTRTGRIDRQCCLGQRNAGDSNCRALRSQQACCSWFDQNCSHRIWKKWYSGQCRQSGAVHTEMLLDVSGSEAAIDRMGTAHPLGRIGRPEEIADAVAWLFSDGSSYYTGQSLTLDGGLTAQRPLAQAIAPEGAAVVPAKQWAAPAVTATSEPSVATR